jgi:uncharacterized protein (DUF2141 family)
MRKSAYITVILSLAMALRAEAPPSTCTLTIVVDGISNSKGVLGLVIFKTPRGWPEDVSSSFRHTAFPAQPGTQTIRISDLPPGKYAVALIHDVNENMKLDKNWVGKPKEQWGMSNNPRARFSAPPFEKAVFELQQDDTIKVQLQ